YRLPVILSPQPVSLALVAFLPQHTALLPSRTVSAAAPYFWRPRSPTSPRFVKAFAIVLIPSHGLATPAARALVLRKHGALAKIGGELAKGVLVDAADHVFAAAFN